MSLTRVKPCVAFCKILPNILSSVADDLKTDRNIYTFILSGILDSEGEPFIVVQLQLVIMCHYYENHCKLNLLWSTFLMDTINTGDSERCGWTIKVLYCSNTVYHSKRSDIRLWVKTDVSLSSCINKCWIKHTKSVTDSCIQPLCQLPQFLLTKLNMKSFNSYRLWLIDMAPKKQLYHHQLQ